MSEPFKAPFQVTQINPAAFWIADANGRTVPLHWLCDRLNAATPPGEPVRPLPKDPISDLLEKIEDAACNVDRRSLASCCIALDRCHADVLLELANKEPAS